MNDKISVCALVVTYNRCNLLKRVVNALRNQTYKIDTILIVNNGSTDCTQDWLNIQNDLVVIIQENLGGSGGFNRGCMYALENDYDYVWLMDDDGYPSTTALNELLNKPNIGLSVANCFVIDENRERLSFPLWHLNKRYDFVDEIFKLNIEYLIGMINPFNGTLVPIEVIRLIGPPHGDMFIWGDESEYYNRILQANIPVLTVLNSEFYHPIAKEVDGGDWPNNIAWKKYYSTRNLLRTMSVKYKSFMFMRYTKAFILLILNVIKKQRSNKIRKIVMLFSAYIDAVFNNFGKLPKDIKSIRFFLK